MAAFEQIEIYLGLERLHVGLKVANEISKNGIRRELSGIRQAASIHGDIFV